MSNIIQQNTILVPVPSPSCKHLFIVLTAPEGEPPVVVMVNITTRRPTSDATVILTSGDHPFIKHESVVAFEHTSLFEVERLENGLSNGSLSKYPDINETLFIIIKQGLLNSPRTPQNIKKYCNSRF
ncbi:MAG: hypothetical protein KAG43_03820 [Candidatus Marithrix sp.]|nr:hypothetical protein [Candidatus Marithrix sp.]